MARAKTATATPEDPTVNRLTVEAPATGTHVPVEATPAGVTPVAPVPPTVPPGTVEAAPAGVRRARVRVPQTHVGAIDVEIPADAAEPRRAAIEAAMAARGILGFGAGPEVEFLD